jgi:hypothetical protein
MLDYVHVTVPYGRACWRVFLDSRPFELTPLVCFCYKRPAASATVAEAAQHAHCLATAPCRLGGTGVLGHPRLSPVAGIVRRDLHVILCSSTLLHRPRCVTVNHYIRFGRSL